MKQIFFTASVDYPRDIIEGLASETFKDREAFISRMREIAGEAYDEDEFYESVYIYGSLNTFIQYMNYDQVDTDNNWVGYTNIEED